MFLSFEINDNLLLIYTVYIIHIVLGILEFVAGSIEIRAVRRRVCVFWGEDHQHQSGRIANTTVNENCM